MPASGGTPASGWSQTGSSEKSHALPKHASTVQSSPSSQSLASSQQPALGAPKTHWWVPSSQLSTVQALPSSQSLSLTQQFAAGGPDWQFPRARLHVSTVHTLSSLQSLSAVQQPFASEGHCVSSPLHTSSASHALVAPRQTVWAGAYATEQLPPRHTSWASQSPLGAPLQAMPFSVLGLSAGQLALSPLQLSVASHSPVAGRQGVPAPTNTL